MINEHGLSGDTLRSFQISLSRPKIFQMTNNRVHNCKRMNTMLCLILLLAVTRHGIASDQPCTDLGGHCQDDHHKCSGSYYSGKCTGSATRRCCTRTAAEHDTGDCSNVKIISRDSWGARRPASTSTIHSPVPDFFIHHTEGGACTSFSACISQMKGIQNYHMDDANHHWSDIGYSFLVGEDGKIYEGRGWNRIGAHTQGYNSRGLAASFMGSFMTHAPNSAALNAVKELIQCGISKGKVSHSYALFGHRDVGSTDCPGTALYNVIKTWPRFHAHSPK